MVLLSIAFVAGCGSKVAGSYTSLGQTLTLANDGSVTLEIPSMQGKGKTDHGSFSYNGKEVMIKFTGNKFVYTFKVAGNNLIDKDSGNTWNKK